jgi:type IV fimbrial biogenesis protein FimT
MVVLAIASILISVGVPSFRGVVLDSRMVSEANQFVSSIGLARSSAVRFQRAAIICTSDDFSVAVPTCSGSTDWSNGWIVWVDKDRDNATDADEIISVQEPFSDTTTFTSTTANRFIYDARGFGLAAADTLTLCDNRTAETGRAVSVNAVGRTNVSQTNCT